MDKELLKKACAECIGTFVLVFFACGTAILSGGNLVATALAFGLVIVAMAYSIGNVSGCHINPAVSLAMLIRKKLNVKEFGFYVLAQFIGGIIGALCLYGIIALGFDKFFDTYNAFATNAYISDTTGGVVASLFAEIILTFVFTYAILGLTSKKENSAVAGVGIGLTLTLVHLIGINLTGTSVNPARSFGPALMSLVVGNSTVALQQVWLFILAPLVGAALAALLFGWLNKEKDSTNA